MCLHHHTQCIPEACVARGISWQVHELTKTFLGHLVKNIDVRRNIPIFSFQGFFEAGHHFRIKIFPKISSQFIMLCE